MYALRMIGWLCLWGSTCLLGYCTKTYLPTNLPDQQLEFGSGGGFTGEVRAYVLLPNGQLFRRAWPSDTLQTVGRLPRSQARALFAQADQLDWKGTSSQPPGNVNTFLIYRNDGEELKLNWPNLQEEAPAPFRDLYSELNEALKMVQEVIK